MIAQPPIVAPPALETRNLAVGYRARRTECAVLRGVNLTVQTGELLCVLGVNGIGKSTLLRTLVRLQRPLTGEIRLAGTCLDAFSQAQLARHVGVVLTERVPIDTLRARRVVELGRYAHSGWWGGLGDSDHRAIEWAVQAAGAGHLMDRDFSRLSDGERQRVMIARALAQEPTVLVLDEPTAFLDVTARIELWGLLRELAVRKQLAVLTSTHDLEHALRTAHRICLLAPGGEVSMGATDELIASGALAAAFASPRIRFDTRERAFHFTEHEAVEGAIE